MFLITSHDKAFCFWLQERFSHQNAKALMTLFSTYDKFNSLKSRHDAKVPLLWLQQSLDSQIQKVTMRTLVLVTTETRHLGFKAFPSIPFCSGDNSDSALKKVTALKTLGPGDSRNSAFRSRHGLTDSLLWL